MKKILQGADARKQIKEGIDKCCDAVKVSMGGHGKNVLIYNGVTTEIINDGVSIAEEVNVKDEVHQAGIMLAKQCAKQTDSVAGDGTTTTLVLLQSILNEIIQDFETVNPRELREEIYKELEELFKRIDIKEVKTKKDLYNLALTSSLDKKVAKAIAEIYEELGSDAKITIDEVDGDVFEYEIVKGIQFESRTADKIIIDVTERKVFENMHVVVMDKVKTPDDIAKHVEKASKEADEMLVIANKFERSVLLSIAQLKNFNIYAIEHTEIKHIDDIITYVGDNTVDKVIIEENSISLIGGHGEVDKKIDLLKEKTKKVKSEYEKEEIDKRIARLSSGVAVIRVGKSTDVERQEAVLKIEDAIKSVRGAMIEGYVKGGGIALKLASEQCSDTKAGNILKAVCNAPYKQICENAGVDELKIPNTVIDSYRTVRHSLINAISTGTSVLTVEAALIKEKEDEC